MRGFSYPIFNMGFPGVFNILWFFTKIVLWAALAVLVILFLPEQTERVSRAAVQQPLLTGGLGLLTAAVLPPLLLLLFISVCLIPVALVLLIVAGLAWAFGLIALGYEVGKRLTALAKQEWAPAVSAGLGTLLLMFVLNASGSLLSCIGLILPFLVGVVGFGAVILTRFGTQTYTTEPSNPRVTSRRRGRPKQSLANRNRQRKGNHKRSCFATRAKISLGDRNPGLRGFIKSDNSALRRRRSVPVRGGM